ncbi:hypothetical protein [Streptomyces sp. NPDC058011]|uniref:hypothetical protein n=1 Tax=Streptomyces sp. NPDC058011 TaxID=3346305 RepID=UPI0036EB3820
METESTDRYIDESTSVFREYAEESAAALRKPVGERRRIFSGSFSRTQATSSLFLTSSTEESVAGTGGGQAAGR